VRVFEFSREPVSVAWAIKCRKNHKIIVNVERISYYTQGAGRQDILRGQGGQ